MTSRSAQACSVCGCGDPLVAASEASPRSGTLRLALQFEYLTARARSDDDPTLTESLSQQTLRPLVVYSPWESLNLVLQVPVVRKSWSMAGIDTPTKSSAPIGLGDVDLGARWFLLSSTSIRLLSRQSLGVLGGTSLPTGPDNTQVDGDRIDQHAQLGTGAFGPYGGIFYAFHRDPWNVFLSTTYRTHTTNSYDYRFGDAMQWSALGQWRAWDRAAFVLGTEGRYSRHDRSAGTTQDDTGGTVIAASPGLMLGITDDLWVHARVQIPFVTHLFGEQSVGPMWLVMVQQTIVR